MRSGARPWHQLGAVVGILILTSPAEAGDDYSPVPRISASPSTLQLSGPVGAHLDGTFTVSNEADCSVQIHGSGYGKPFDIKCSRTELQSHETVNCEVRMASEVAGRFSRRFTLVGQVGEECKKKAKARLSSKIGALLNRLYARLVAMRREKIGQEYIGQALAKLDDRFKVNSAKLETRANHQIEAKEKRLLALSNDYQSFLVDQRRRVERKLLKVKILSTENPAVAALDIELARRRKEAAKSIDEAHDATVASCAAPSALRAKMKAALDELKSGAYHSECGRTASEIRRDTGESLSEHLGKIGGHMRPAPKEKIEAKRAEYERQIREAERRCAELTEREHNLAQNWVKQVRELDQRRVVLERQRLEAIRKAKAELQKIVQDGSKVKRSKLVQLSEAEEAVAAENRRFRKKEEELRSMHARDYADLQRTLSQKRQAQEEEISDAVRVRRRLEDQVADIDARISNSHLNTRRVEILIRAQVSSRPSKRETP